MQIEGFVAVVSGGASGLGEASVRYLAEKGAQVSILDLGEENGEKIASELGASVVFCKTDVTNEENKQDHGEFWCYPRCH
jgi:NADP-dependent 3-hydroxy acid dehydrogenase YdfG